MNLLIMIAILTIWVVCGNFISKLQKEKKSYVLIIGGSFMVTMILVAIIGTAFGYLTGTMPPEPINAQVPATSLEPAPEAKNDEQPPELLEDTCLTLAHMFSGKSKLTDMQKETEWEKYKGKIFQWKVKVTDISSKTFGGFAVQAICVGSDSFIQDVYIEYPKEAKELLSPVQKGDRVTVKGKLVHYLGDLTGMSAIGLTK